MGVPAKTARTGAEAPRVCATAEGVITGAGLVAAYLVSFVRADGSAATTAFIIVATCCICSYVCVIGLVSAGLGLAMGFVVVCGGRVRCQRVYLLV